GRSVRAMRDDQRPTFFTYWQVTLLLGFLFLVVMIIQWLTANIDNQYGAIFRVMVGYHALHAIVIGLIMWRVLRTAQAGGYSPRDYFGVEGSARLWYFVVVAWVLFYIVLYVI
ncbi:MAG: cytochrome c oxidase subunit 3, partial [Anaerolinea sp.]|nr:cytochrome c oxidase subunit 3 [Anaerolinea sp.]